MFISVIGFRAQKRRFVFSWDRLQANKTAKTDAPVNVESIVFVCVLEYLRL